MQKEEQKLRANIWKLYVLRGLRSFMFAMPVFVIFLNSIGLSMTEVFITQSFFAFVILVSEIPSGYFADRFGKRLSLILGSVFSVAGIVTYTLSFDLFTVLIAELFLGISLAFISGADSALLYETLAALGEKDTYKKREGRMFTSASSAEGIASVLGGFIALISLHAPFVAHASLMLFMIPIAWSLYEPKELRAHASLLASGTALTTMWRTFVHTMHTHTVLKWLIITNAIIATATLIAVWFRQPYFQILELPLGYFGIAWALFMFAASGGALIAEWYENRIGKAYALAGLVGASAIGFVLAGIHMSYIALLALFVLSIVHGIREPLMRTYVQELADSHLRTTILSIQSFVSRMPFIVLGPLAGWVMDVYSLQMALIASGITTLVFGLIALGMLARARAHTVY